eukprot:364938-Chlamydomonas_euryale.AAC.34
MATTPRILCADVVPWVRLTEPTKKERVATAAFKKGAANSRRRIQSPMQQHCKSIQLAAQLHFVCRHMRCMNAWSMSYYVTHPLQSVTLPGWWA